MIPICCEVCDRLIDLFFSFFVGSVLILWFFAVGDFDKIWREHCEDAQTLSEYALAMKNLADNHWAINCEGEGRIEWCRRYS